VSIKDTGLLHAAGAFTTMRAYQGQVFRLADHLMRLRDTCTALFVPMQYKDEQIAEAIAALLKANELADARLRLTITRGAVTQDPLHGMHLHPTAILTATAFEPYPAEYYEKGMTVLAYDLQKLNPYDMQAGHKTLNYFSRLAAMRDANRRGAGEALWFNVHNYLQCGSVSNIFLVKRGELLTAPTQAELDDPQVATDCPYPRSNVLPGVTRKVILELAQEHGLSIRRQGLSIDDLLGADECFITNSIMEVMPVCRVERKPLGADKPGDLTRRLAMLYRTAIDRALANS
jgi:branched-chain amino acid aminotransferase